jgi:molybdopterin synthase catalytic subunit
MAMKFRCSHRSKAADASSIYDVRFTIYDLPAAKMKRQLTITTERIDEAALLSKRRMSDGMGAVVCFLGVVRGTEEDRAISAIEYEAFLRMAEHQFNRLFDQMEKRWPIESVRLVHRIGVVQVNEPSLWVEVVGPHRREAFAASQWLIDEMKRVVPIWKRPRT